MTRLPTPYAAARIAAFLEDHPAWSAYWDKHCGLWRVAEDDPDSDLHAESRDAEVVIRYITAHDREKHCLRTSSLPSLALTVPSPLANTGWCSPAGSRSRPTAGSAAAAAACISSPEPAGTSSTCTTSRHDRAQADARYHVRSVAAITERNSLGRPVGAELARNADYSLAREHV